MKPESCSWGWSQALYACYVTKITNDKQCRKRPKSHWALHLIEALLHLTDKVISALNNEFTCSIFIDLSKGFDTVNPYILLEKLHKYVFHDSTYKWLRHYVSNRRQFVCVKGYNSNRAKLICGVLQGSILGPLLFLIYINDLSNI